MVVYYASTDTHTCLAQADATKLVPKGPQPLINHPRTEIIQAVNISIATILPEECPTTPCEEISKVLFGVECLVFWGLQAVCIAEFNCHP